MNTDFISCICGNSDGTWVIYDSAGHTKHNVDSISVSNGKLIVNFKSSLDIRNILTFVVANDETYSAMGIMAGASVGFDCATITISRLINGNMQVIDAADLITANGNFLIYGLVEVY